MFYVYTVYMCAYNIITVIESGWWPKGSCTLACSIMPNTFTNRCVIFIVSESRTCEHVSYCGNSSVDVE